MGFYRVESNSRGVLVRHRAVFPFLFGCVAILIAGIVFYQVLPDLADTTGLDYWVPFGLGAAFFIIGCYLVLWNPSSKRILFLAGSKQIEANERGLLANKTKVLVHDGIESFKVEVYSNDGDWYTPTIQLDNGETLEIGFGCPTYESAESIMNEIIELIKRSGK